MLKKITIFLVLTFGLILFAGCNNQTTTQPTTAPITDLSTTESETTEVPTTQAATTVAPTTVAPTTEAPTTLEPTTVITTSYLESIIDSLVITTEVSENFYLPAEIENVTVTWSSNNTEYLSISNEVDIYEDKFAYPVTVIRPSYEIDDIDVMITGIFHLGEEELSQEFYLTILKTPAQYYLDLDLALIDSTYLIEDEFALPSLDYSIYENIVISLEITDYLTYLDGTFSVIRPETDTSGTITFDVVYGDAIESLTVSISILSIPLEATYIENFSWVDTTSTAYATAFTNVDEFGFSWSLFGRGDSAYFALGNAADGSYAQVTASGGISSFSIDLVRAFTNTNLRSVELFVNDVSFGVFDISTTSDVWQTFTVDNINVTGDVVIKIISTSPSTRGAFYINNFTWTTYSEENIG